MLVTKFILLFSNASIEITKKKYILNMRSISYKILLLLSFTLGYHVYAEGDNENKNICEYSDTHAFSKEENVKEFSESLNRVKDYLLRKSIQDENKSIKKREEDFETLTTLTRDVFEQGSFCNEAAEKDMLFNSYFIEQALLTRDHKGKAILDSFLEDKETISEELVTCINLITRNNWYTKADNLRRLELYEEEEGARNIKKIKDLYKTFKEDEYELVRLFSSEPAKDRYGIDNYNWFIDFTEKNLAIPTRFFTLKLLGVVIYALLLVIYIIFDREKGGEATIESLLKSVAKAIEEVYPKYSSLGLIAGILNYVIEITNYFLNLITLKYFDKIKTYILNFNIKNTIFTSIIVILSYQIDKLLFRPRNFNYKLFRKFHVISRYIKTAHSLYNICRNNKHLQLFLYNDLVNLRRFFETEDKDLKDLINTALNMSPYRIWLPHVKKIANFILRFDNSREKFLGTIFDFLVFKNYINTMQMKNNNNNMSQKWSTPTFINESMSLKFKNLYNIALKKGGIPTDIYFDKNNRGLFFRETTDYSEKKLQQALMLCFLCINGYGICPCEKAEVCVPDYFHYTPDMFTDSDINNSNLEKWTDVATIYFERIANIKNFYKKKKGKDSNPTFFNIMNETQENEKGKMFVNLILNILKDDYSFLYLINHNDDVHEIKSKYPKLACANKSLEGDEYKIEIVNDWL